MVKMRKKASKQGINFKSGMYAMLLCSALGLSCSLTVTESFAAGDTAVISGERETRVIDATGDSAESTAAAVNTSGAPDGMSEEDYARLCDSTIEWDEIDNIIKYRNPTYKMYSARVDESIGSMKASASDDIADMKEQLDNIDSSIDAIKAAQEKLIESGGSTAGDAYKKLSESLDASKSLKSSVENGIDQLGVTSRTLKYGQKNSELGLAPLRYQLTSVIEGLIISYKTLEANREMLSEQINLYEALYNTYKAMQSQAMATEQNVAAYKEQADTARASLEQLEAGMARLKGNILIQCGYASDAEVTIAELPKADRGFLSGRDTGNDRKTAVDGSSSVIAAAKVSGYTGDVLKYRDAGENAAASDVSIKFDNIKSELEKQLVLCETSETSLKRAEILKNSADTKNALGMLGRGEYEGLKLQYIAAEAAAKINELNLLQAVENYKFSLKGVM